MTQTQTEASLRSATKVMIRGAPVTQEYVDKIGVEVFAEDVFRATQIGKELLGLA